MQFSNRVPSKIIKINFSLALTICNLPKYRAKVTFAKLYVLPDGYLYYRFFIFQGTKNRKEDTIGNTAHNGKILAEQTSTPAICRPKSREKDRIGERKIVLPEEGYRFVISLIATETLNE